MTKMLNDGYCGTNETVNALLEKSAAPKVSCTIFSGIIEQCSQVSSGIVRDAQALDASLMRLKVLLDAWAAGKEELEKGIKLQMEDYIYGFHV